MAPVVSVAEGCHYDIINIIVIHITISIIINNNIINLIINIDGIILLDSLTQAGKALWLQESPLQKVLLSPYSL